MNPRLSVVMPTYNGEKFIGDALESVCIQFRDDIELVIVDDGSSDRTLEIVNKFARLLPIRLITPGRIGNWVKVTNIGLREASGEWACLLHQDDLWLAGRIDRIWQEMESAKGALILHDARFVGPDGKVLGPWTCPIMAGDVPPDEFVEHLLIQNFIAIPSPLFRRREALESNGLDEALWFSADWDLWLRLGAMGPVRFIPEILAAFRIHPASQTASRKTASNEWDLQLTTVLERHLKTWNSTPGQRTSVERTAKASVAVNSALSALSRGEHSGRLEVATRLIALGPTGWHRYLRDSRIAQRVIPRLKLQGLRRREI